MATWRSWMVSTGFRTVCLALASMGAGNRGPTELPGNLDVDPTLRTYVAAMWQGSATFRQQCRRIAAEPDVLVTLLPEEQQHRPATARARTVVSLVNGRPASARVYLTPSVDAPKLIAHELEHIIEQLDHVDLADHAGKGAVWKYRNGSYETQRAIDAEHGVARELAGRDTSRAVAAWPAGITERLATVMLREDAAAPWSAGAARASGDGRLVVLISRARLVEQDQNDLRDAYVLDVRTGVVTLESGGAGGRSGNGETWSADISRDGRYVVFASDSWNLTDSPHAPGQSQVFVRDRARGATRLLSTNPLGTPANGASRNPVISADGARVAFESTSTDLVPAISAGNGAASIYLEDVNTGVRVRVDDSTPGDLRPGQSMTPALSADGRVVAFASTADLSGSVNPRSSRPGDVAINNVYVRDTVANTTQLVSRGLSGAGADGPSYHPALSGDGHSVAFVSQASNLTSCKTGGVGLLHVYDRRSGEMSIIPAAGRSALPDGPSVRPALSYDGSRVAFLSLAANLVCARRCAPWQRDVNLVWDVFVHDRVLGRSVRVSADRAGWMEVSGAPALDHTGRVVAFASRHPIDGNDVGHDLDLFVVGFEPEVTGMQPR